MHNIFLFIVTVYMRYRWDETKRGITWIFINWIWLIFGISKIARRVSFACLKNFWESLSYFERKDTWRKKITQEITSNEIRWANFVSLLVNGIRTYWKYSQLFPNRIRKLSSLQQQINLSVQWWFCYNVRLLGITLLCLSSDFARFHASGFILATEYRYFSIKSERYRKISI